AVSQREAAANFGRQVSSCLRSAVSERLNHLNPCNLSFQTRLQIRLGGRDFSNSKTLADVRGLNDYYYRDSPFIVQAKSCLRFGDHQGIPMGIRSNAKSFGMAIDLPQRFPANCRYGGRNRLQNAV